MGFDSPKKASFYCAIVLICVNLQKKYVAMTNNIILLENETLIREMRFPYQFSMATQMVITSGSLRCVVDFRTYSLTAPAMAIFLRGQVIESLETDGEFAVFGMMIGHEFISSMNLPVSLQEKLFIKNTQFHTISEQGMEAYMSCYRQVASIMRQKDNPYREQIIKHLFSAYYYSLGYYVHGKPSAPVTMSLQEQTCDRFIDLVSKNFKQERDIGFYANKLCISNKYLSTLLKQTTGMTALEWIERYVVLYAKSCLTSTTMTIQQISDELLFPSQSVFGKYFKRVEGISPRAYRQLQNGEE